jgi:hypothetical protein
MDKQVLESPDIGPQLAIALTSKKPGEPCQVCASELKPGAKKCNECKSYQDGTKCRSCGYLMAPGSARCSVCNSYQNWRRLVPDGQILLALAVTLLSLLTAFVPHVYEVWNYRSKTMVRVLGLKERTVGLSKEYIVLAEVLNTGGKASIVRRAWIEFKGLGLNTQEATIENPDKMMVLPNQPVILNLSVGGLSKIDTKMLHADILKKIETGQVAVTLEVEETNRSGEQHLERASDSRHAGSMKDLVERYVP